MYVIMNNFWCLCIVIKWVLFLYFYSFKNISLAKPIHTSRCLSVTDWLLAPSMTFIILRVLVLWFTTTLRQIRNWLAPATKAHRVSFHLGPSRVVWKSLRCLHFSFFISLRCDVHIWSASCWFLLIRENGQKIWNKKLFFFVLFCLCGVFCFQYFFQTSLFLNSVAQAVEFSD